MTNITTRLFNRQKNNHVSAFPASAELLLLPFLNSQLLSPSCEDYAHLFQYFIEGFMTYRSPLGARAYYPGLPSTNGIEMDWLEGFSRIAPLIAAWLHGGRSNEIILSNKHRVELDRLLQEGIAAGTNPQSAEYWGPIKDLQQSIVEAADIALTLWLTKDIVWDKLTENQKNNAIFWLSQVNDKQVRDNNWHLFVVQINSILDVLNFPYDNISLKKHYTRVKEFYAGDGWFKDKYKNHMNFDYYNAWGFHYQLQWINKIYPTLDDSFIAQCFRDFLSNYKYLIGPKGFPVLGRSISYRMSVPAPLVFGQVVCPDIVSPGEARRALDCIWQYFIRNGAVKSGSITQGYFGQDKRLKDDYSGPTSAFWSLRSLIPAFALPDDSTFWQTNPESLPIERKDYRIHIPSTGWTIVGDKNHQSITIHMPNTNTKFSTVPKRNLISRALNYITRGKFDEDKISMDIQYNLSEYSSDNPFGGYIKAPKNSSQLLIK